MAFRLCHTLAPHRHRDRWRSMDRGQAQPTEGVHRRPRQVQQRSGTRLASAEIYAATAVLDEGSAPDKGGVGVARIAVVLFFLRKWCRNDAICYYLCSVNQKHNGYITNIQNIPIALLECNEGQIEGLPRNPRFIKDERFEKLTGKTAVKIAE